MVVLQKRWVAESRSGKHPGVTSFKAQSEDLMEEQDQSQHTPFWATTSPGPFRIMCTTSYPWIVRRAP
jgi:hypothetical protein